MVEYENKNEEILKQNYKDKKRSFELIKGFSLDFQNDKFHKILFEVLEKETRNLKNRLL